MHATNTSGVIKLRIPGVDNTANEGCMESLEAGAPVRWEKEEVSLSREERRFP